MFLLMLLSGAVASVVASAASVMSDPWAPVAPVPVARSALSWNDYTAILFCLGLALSTWLLSWVPRLWRSAIDCAASEYAGPVHRGVLRELASLRWLSRARRRVARGKSARDQSRRVHDYLVTALGRGVYAEDAFAVWRTARAGSCRARRAQHCILLCQLFGYWRALGAARPFGTSPPVVRHVPRRLSRRRLRSRWWTPQVRPFENGGVVELVGGGWASPTSVAVESCVAVAGAESVPGPSVDVAGTASFSTAQRASTHPAFSATPLNPSLGTCCPNAGGSGSAAGAVCVTTGMVGVTSAEASAAPSAQDRYYAPEAKVPLLFVRPHIGVPVPEPELSRGLFLLDSGSMLSAVSAGYVRYLRDSGVVLPESSTEFRVSHGDTTHIVRQRVTVPLLLGDQVCHHPCYVLPDDGMPGRRAGLLGLDFAERFVATGVDFRAREFWVRDRRGTQHRWSVVDGDVVTDKPEPWTEASAWAAEDLGTRTRQPVGGTIGGDDVTTPGGRVAALEACLERAVRDARPRLRRGDARRRQAGDVHATDGVEDAKDFYRFVGPAEESEIERKAFEHAGSAPADAAASPEIAGEDPADFVLRRPSREAAGGAGGRAPSWSAEADIHTVYIEAPKAFLAEQELGRASSVKARAARDAAIKDARMDVAFRQQLGTVLAAHQLGLSDLLEDPQSGDVNEVDAEALKRQREAIYQAEAALEEEVDAEFTKLCEELLEDVMATVEDPGVMDDPEFLPFIKDLIRVKSGVPVQGWKKRYRGEMGKWLKEVIDNMIAAGTARLSTSPYDNPVLIVPKRRSEKIVGWRLVFDMRELNKDTVPLPNNPPDVWDVLHSLRNAKVLSDLDLAGGYMQLRLADDEQMARTAFTARTQFGNTHAELTTTSIGLLNAQAAFIAAVNHTLRARLFKDIFTLADDVTVATETTEEHLDALAYIRRQAKRYGFRFEKRKCKFGRRTLIKFGFLVGNGEIRVAPMRKQAMLDYPRPVDVKGVQRFLGLIQYWRPLVKNAAVICEPLTRLLRSTTRWEWGTQQEAAFNTLKSILSSELVLEIPDPDARLYIDTDASPTGVGAVAYHIRDGQKRPVWYFSRKLAPHQRNYSTTEKELLAVVMAIERLDPIIGGREFTLNTDARNVLWLFNNPVVRGAASIRVARWVLKLQRMSGLMTLQHVPAEQNKAADAFSRLFEDEKAMSLVRAAGLQPAEGMDAIDLDDVDAVKNVPFDVETVYTAEAREVYTAEDPNYKVSGAPRRPVNDSVAAADGLFGPSVTATVGCVVGESNTTTLDAIPDGDVTAETDAPAPERVGKQYKTQFGSLTTTKRIRPARYPSAREWRRAQEDELKGVLAFVQDPSSVREVPAGFSGVELYLHESDDGAPPIVYAKVPLDGEVTAVPVVPPSLRPTLLQLAHDVPVAGHRGAEATLQLLRRMGFWPQMQGSVEHYVETCSVCGRQRAFRSRPPVNYFAATQPGHTVHMDYVGPIHESTEGYKYMLTLMDRFTGYTVIVPTWRADSASAAWGLINHWFPHFGLPVRMVTDQGKHFQGWEFRVLRDWLWTEHVRTSAYHPQTNGKIERMHRTLKDGLKKFCNEENRLWAELLPALVFQMNNTRSASGFSPHELMMGWRPRAPFVGETQRPPAYSFSSQMFAFKEQLARRWRQAALAGEYSAARASSLDRRRYRIVEFSVGSEVWKLRQPGEGRPYEKAVGPCVVEADVSRGQGQSFRVRLPGGRRSVVNVRDLRPYLRRAGDVSEDGRNARCSFCGDWPAQEAHVACAGCPCVYHLRCAGLPLDVVPSGQWLCSDCTERSAGPEQLSSDEVAAMKAYEDAMYGDARDGVEAGVRRGAAVQEDGAAVSAGAGDPDESADAPIEDRGAARPSSEVDVDVGEGAASAGAAGGAGSEARGQASRNADGEPADESQVADVARSRRAQPRQRSRRGAPAERRDQQASERDQRAARRVRGDHMTARRSSRTTAGKRSVRFSDED